jgi:hypothetical protein
MLLSLVHLPQEQGVHGLQLGVLMRHFDGPGEELVGLVEIPERLPRELRVPHQHVGVIWTPLHGDFEVLRGGALLLPDVVHEFRKVHRKAHVGANLEVSHRPPLRIRSSPRFEQTERVLVSPNTILDGQNATIRVITSVIIENGSTTSACTFHSSRLHLRLKVFPLPSAFQDLSARRRLH